MMHGIDTSFDGAVYIGYHASTSNMEGVRAHTMSSANVTDLQLNGVPMTEGSWNAAIAGHFGVPVIMISGDDAAVKEVQSVVGPIEGAVVKWNHGFHSATTMTPAAGAKVVADKVRAAVERIDDFEAYVPEGPLVIRLSLKHYQPVEQLAYLRDVTRVGSHTIEYRATDMVDASKFLRFVLGYSVSTAP